MAAAQNITVTMDEEVARWVRVKAAELNTSVSRYLGDILRVQMEREQGYAKAMRRYFSEPPAKLRRSPKDRLPSRDEVHDRRGLR